MDRLREVAGMDIRPAIELVYRRSYATEIIGAVCCVLAAAGIVLTVWLM